jgi:hypothetical protein
MTVLAALATGPGPVLGGGRDCRAVHGQQPVGRSRAGRCAGARTARAEFFGLWMFAVRLSAILGPMTYGLVTWLTDGNHRLAIVSHRSVLCGGAGPADPGQRAARHRGGGAANSNAASVWPERTHAPAAARLRFRWWPVRGHDRAAGLVAQLNRCGKGLKPGCSRQWGTDVHRQRGLRGHQRPAPSSCRVPPSVTGTPARRHGSPPGSRRAGKAAGPGAATKVPSGNTSRAHPSLHLLGHVLRVGHTAPCVEALDEGHAQAPEEAPGHPLLLQFPLGHEGHGPPGPPPAPVRPGSWRGCTPARSGHRPAGVPAPARPASAGQAQQQPVRPGGRNAQAASESAAAPPPARQRVPSARTGAGRASRTGVPDGLHPWRSRSTMAPPASRSHWARTLADRRSPARLLDQGAAGRAPHLAAGGLEHRVGWHQQDLVGGLADGRDHRLRHGIAQAAMSDFCARADLGQHDQALGAAAASRRPKTATQPLRTPFTSPTASSISCG